MVAGAVALMTYQLELAVRSVATLVLLAADVGTGFKNAATIMQEYGRSVALATGQLVEFEKKLLGLATAAANAPRGASDPLKGGGKGGGGDGADKLKKETEALQKRADAIAASVNPQNQFNQTLAELNMLLEKGFLSDVNYALAKEKATEALHAAGDAVRAATDPLFVYNRELEKLAILLGRGEISFETWTKAAEKAKEALDEAEGKGKKKEKTMMEYVDDLASVSADALGDFFGALISGSATAEEAFKKMAETILSEIAKIIAQLLAAQAVKFAASFFGGATSTAPGSGEIARASTTAATSALSAGAAALTAGAATMGAPATRMTGTDSVPASAPGQGTSLNVVVNNNVPGAEVTTAVNSAGDLEITIDRVRRALSRDMSRGGNIFSDTLERSYGVGRAGTGV